MASRPLSPRALALRRGLEREREAFDRKFPPHQSYLERRALEQERDAFNRKYPPGSVLKLKPGRYGSLLEVEVQPPGAAILFTLIIVNVNGGIHQVCIGHIDFGPEGAP